MAASLCDETILNKIDKLRELNIGAIVPLPQLVVVGDQSSGKSSVLESLTGFNFPRAAGLCTRYATQITCYRAPQQSISISIIPRPNADEDLKKRLRHFGHQFNAELDQDKLAQTFQEADFAMGIRKTTGDNGNDLITFSEDILKIEICGPDQNHLTVIDVPGIFRVPTPGFTTEDDAMMVQSMVKAYMNNSRTIILAVLPCNVDIQTQEVIKLAKTADPGGSRTMGVLTKPDLACEKTTQEAVIELVNGKHDFLKLGYFVVKNRGADDTVSTISARLDEEKVFFMDPAWATVQNRCGIDSLRVCLRELLMDISKDEFPQVKYEVKRRLCQKNELLHKMGPSRATHRSQRLYLSKLASTFQMITLSALEGHYMRDEIFKNEPNLKLATRMVKLNETFADIFWQKGHKRAFGPAQNDEGESSLSHSTDDLRLQVPLQKYRELSDIIRVDEDDLREPKSSEQSIVDHIEHVYESNRGPELGTFGGTILSIVFREQSEKWRILAISHTSKAIAVVHDYIFSLLTKLCHEEQVKMRIWDLLVDKLCDAYRRAMEHARFLLDMERGIRPTTFNHYFNANLQKTRNDRLLKNLNSLAEKLTYNSGTSSQYSVDYIAVSKLRGHAVDKDNAQQVREDILDALTSYYKVSRKRFVDAICQQVVNYFLLEGDQGPLKIFGPDLINSLEPQELDFIAGEGSASKLQRQTLQRETESLEAAVEVLRV